MALKTERIADYINPCKLCDLYFNLYLVPLVRERETSICFMYFSRKSDRKKERYVRNESILKTRPFFCTPSNNDLSIIQSKSRVKRLDSKTNDARSFKTHEKNALQVSPLKYRWVTKKVQKVVTVEFENRKLIR